MPNCTICGKPCKEPYQTCFSCNKEAKQPLQKPEFKTAKEMPINTDIQKHRIMLISYAKDLVIAREIKLENIQYFLNNAERYIQTGVFDDEKEKN